MRENRHQFGRNRRSGSLLGVGQNQTTHITEGFTSGGLNRNRSRMKSHGSNYGLHGTGLIGHNQIVVLCAQVTKCETSAFLQVSASRKGIHGSCNGLKTLFPRNDDPVKGIGSKVRENVDFVLGGFHGGTSREYLIASFVNGSNDLLDGASS